jgi:hypothetical protein
MCRFVLPVFCLVILASVAIADEPAKKTARDALKPLNDLIGTWRCTGEPEGTREQKQRGFWVEGLQWEWQFKGDDAWLIARFDRSKHFTGGELRFLPSPLGGRGVGGEGANLSEPDRFQLKLETLAKEILIFTGTLADRKLIVERVDAETKETHRLVFTLLHDNRFLYRSEVKPADRSVFARRYQVGATKEGVPFASLTTTAPECIVSEGLGTIPVMYKGQTYYVCCTGCRDAFKEDPEKYIKEYNERKAKEREKKAAPPK